jgi:hypothetical protein
VAHQDSALVYSVCERTSISFNLNNFGLFDKGIKHAGFKSIGHEGCDITRQILSDGLPLIKTHYVDCPFLLEQHDQLFSLVVVLLSLGLRIEFIFNVLRQEELYDIFKCDNATVHDNGIS